MSYCGKCGAEVKEEAKFCSKCGTPQKKVVKSNNISIEKSYDDNDFTQIIPKVQPGSTPGMEHEDYEDSDNKSLNGVIIGALIGIIILAVGFGGYYFYGKKNNSSNVQNTSTETTEKMSANKNDTAEEKGTASKDGKEVDKSNKTDNISNTNNTSNNAKSSDYIFYNSASVRLTDTQVNSLSRETLAISRNEIFARHGYIFETEPYKSYFNNKTWYKSNASFKGSDEELNEVEKYNVKLFLKYEDRK